MSLSQPSGPPPGLTVGGYALVSRIGEGGMGVVHLATDEAGREIAVKVLRPHIVGDDEARARLAREVNSLSRIRSSWVAEIVDADPWGEIPFVATRYVAGPSLHQLVKEQGVIDHEQLPRFAACLAHALQAVHSVGVLHRDIKPSNVLMDGPTPVLIDFGLARVADDIKVTQTGWLMGTPGYLAPEILHGLDPTPAADIHSWAATVAYAATGRGPFGKGPAMAVMDRVRRGEHDLTGIDDPLLALVEAALDPDPSARPSLADLIKWLPAVDTEDTVVLDEVPLTVPLSVPFIAPTPPSEAWNPRHTPHPQNAPAAPAAPHTPVAPMAAPMADPVADPTLVDQAPVEPMVAPMRAPYQEPPPVDRGLAPPQQIQPAPQHYPQAYDPYPADDLIPGLQPYPQRTPLAERLRRSLLVLTLLALGVAWFVVAPVLAGLGIVLLAWAARALSYVLDGHDDRRVRRGSKWYDAVVAPLSLPWHLLGAIPGGVMLAFWSTGLALAGALVCFAVALPLLSTMTVIGSLFVFGAWCGPGADRFRRPVRRAVDPLARYTGVWALTGLALLGLLFWVVTGPIEAGTFAQPTPFADWPVRWPQR